MPTTPPAPYIPPPTSCHRCGSLPHHTTSHTWSITGDGFHLCPTCTTLPSAHCLICGATTFYAQSPGHITCSCYYVSDPACTTQASAAPPQLEGDSYSIRPGAPHPLLPLNLLVGLEIEALHPISSRPPALAPFGQLKFDGSLRWLTDNVARHCFELATHATSGDRLIPFLRSLCDTLRSEACEVNHTCGLHIHVDMTSLTSPQRNNLMFWWLIYEDLFFAIQPPSRRSNQYSTPARNFHSIADWRSTRRAALNLYSYTVHQTFEWRLGAGTLNHDEILLQIQLILGFIKAFQDRAPLSGPDDPHYRHLQSLDDRPFLLHFLKEIALPLPAIKHLIRRLRVHTPSTLSSSPTTDSPANPDEADDNNFDEADDDDFDDEVQPAAPRTFITTQNL